MPYTFHKMHGAGNDFVVIDARNTPLSLREDGVRTLAARSNTTTKGCDQLIVLEPSSNADVFMRIYNADGSQVDACGNATRCVGWLLIEAQQDKARPARIETNAGMLECIVSTLNNSDGDDAYIEADMGAPRFDWQTIPLSSTFDTQLLQNVAAQLGINADNYINATCVGMGNPHVVFFVRNRPTTAELQAMGEMLRDHKIPLFATHGVNLTLVFDSIDTADDTLSAVVYERGAGMTKACGTAACATAVAAIALGYRKKDTDIPVHQLQNGHAKLTIRWDAQSNHVKLTGGVTTEFTGTLAL